ncbi:pre-mRNA 3-end-processing factor fip1l1 [Lunasporangiospora selenospora]|uniref:Pre-mRNA 3-end-processing factor fip1l1 n=1 Tax=Lunasporangiospora selenospora TaxID=979761 RepID=A0A9P6KIU3_9FUNG|nr:pre-mRNA 3-end-processing factor fip1l1 [Lunasporangiospora selenospora]
MSSHIPDDMDDDEFLYGSPRAAANAPENATNAVDSEAFDLYGTGESGSSAADDKSTAKKIDSGKGNSTSGASGAGEDSVSGAKDGEKDEEDGDEDEDEDEDEEEEDSESDIEIVMDAEERYEPSNTSKQTIVNIKPANASKSGATTVTNANGTVDVIPATKPGGVDINAVGTVDGVEIFDVDLDGAEDKPWRKPGADLTDYFNYGFNETIWRAYCQKQKMLREHPLGKV